MRTGLVELQRYADQADSIQIWFIWSWPNDQIVSVR